MDQHSAKVVEIERITGLKELFNKVLSIKIKVTRCWISWKFYQSKEIKPEISVALRTFMTEYGDFEKLLPLSEDELTGDDSMLNVLSLSVLLALLL